jgi:GrpB-like predicted nucleotidyltransferase (UPF0157 family)
MLASRIIVEPWSPEWAENFRALESVYRKILGEWVKAIHHVGSTSVPGLPAKAIIDIDLEIERMKFHLPVKEKLLALGYQHAGDLGIPQREMYKRTEEEVPLDGSGRKWPAHHLYVIHSENTALRNHLAFRDYLRENPVKAAEYGELKKKLAQEHPFDIDFYVQKKTAFVMDGLRAKGFDEETISSIIAQNKAIGR